MVSISFNLKTTFQGLLILSMGLAWGPPSTAQESVLPNPTVVGFSSQFNSTRYAAENIADSVIGINGDWAGVGAGPHTVDLDFGGSTTFSSINYTQRNDVGSPGVDDASTLNLFVSDSGVFGGTPEATVAPNSGPATANYDFGDLEGQFLRLEATGTGGNVGGAEVTLLAPTLPSTVLGPPTVVDFSSQFNDTRYAASNLVDGIIGVNGDWAGVGAGPHLVDLDFGSVERISSFDYTQRADVGSPGVDDATTLELFFSNDGNFASTPDLTFSAVGGTETTNYQFVEDELAQFVRFQVSRPSGGNVGGAELTFLASETPGSRVIPEPSSVAGFLLLAWVGLSRSRRVRS